jgi:hypothetical protein
LGPLPDMYEDTWQVPGKLLSAYAEGAAVVLAGLGLLTHRWLRSDLASPAGSRRAVGHRRPGNQWQATGPPRSSTSPSSDTNRHS